MTPAQCRAARGLLDLSQQALAEAAGVSHSTIKDFEGGRRVPIANNLAAIQRVFVTKGVDVTPDTGGTAVLWVSANSKSQ